MAGKIEDLFAAKFVLPEHTELYLQYKAEEKLVPHPVLEEDELASLYYLIRESVQEDAAVTVTWWKPVKDNLGTTCSMWGVIKWIDQHARRMKLTNDEDVEWIDLGNIVAVKA